LEPFRRSPAIRLHYGSDFFVFLLFRRQHRLPIGAVFFFCPGERSPRDSNTHQRPFCMIFPPPPPPNFSDENSGDFRDMVGRHKTLLPPPSLYYTFTQTFLHAFSFEPLLPGPPPNRLPFSCFARKESAWILFPPYLPIFRQHVDENATLPPAFLIPGLSRFPI